MHRHDFRYASLTVEKKKKRGWVTLKKPTTIDDGNDGGDDDVVCRYVSFYVSCTLYMLLESEGYSP